MINIFTFTALTAACLHKQEEILSVLLQDSKWLNIEKGDEMVENGLTVDLTATNRKGNEIRKQYEVRYLSL